MEHFAMPLNPATIDRFPRPSNTSASTELLDVAAGADLQAAIEQLYEAFADVALGIPVHCCPHCYTDADRTYLALTPRRSLTLSDSAYILTCSTTTIGTPRDLNYFLPRLLETWALGAHYMPEVMPSKLEVARDAGWTAPQLEAVLAFMRALLAAVHQLRDNSLWYEDLDAQALEKLASVFPELRTELTIELHDPNARSE